MEEAQTLEEIYKSIEEQSQLDDQRRTLENPTPYFSLLHYPSRASWRSSDHILGVPPPSNSHVHSLLAQTQFNILQHSERTNKQLKRTYKRIMETHKLLAVKRERERRLAANLSSPTTNKLNDNNVVGSSSEDSDGTIQDGRGRHVGDWIDKKNTKKKSRIIDSSETLCDDPSVALSLSMGLSGSRNLAADYDTTISNNINPPDASSMNVVKSANSANKLAKSKDMSSSTSTNERPVGYSAEQTLTNLRYRFGPNYSIVKRVLSEVQSLLGGNKPPPRAVGSSSSKYAPFQPKRVLDFGCGVGSSSAAALDVFGVCRNESTGATTSNINSSGVEWIHSIDASKSMRDTTERVLSSVLQASPWEEEEDDDSDSFLKTEEDRLLDEELIKYEKEIGQLLKGGGGKGGRDNVDMKRLERQRKRMAKWEHTWTKQSNARTRLTFGESIVDTSSFYSDQIDQYKEDKPALPWQAKLDEQRRLTKEMKKEKDDAAKQSSVNQKKKQGSFDLILCSYTLSELPNVPSSLAASTLLWEKLAPNGILVFVEPGTPDGFGILRSVRSMLLECCPPPEIKDRRRRRREAAAAEAAAAMEEEAREKERIEQEDGNSSDAEDGEDVVTSASIPIEEDHDNWPEECHVIAPCTHNGSCPMSRHQRNHVKRNTRFGKYEAAAEPNEVEQDENGEVERNDSDREEEEDGDMNIQDLLSNWDYMTESDKDELKMMMGGDDDMSDDEAKAMLEYMESMEGGSESDEDDGDDSDSDDEVDEQEYYNIDQDTTSTESSNNKESSTMKQTDVFDTSFCSFVHKFPGGTSRKKGEKFTYLVLQKRVPEESNDNASVPNPMKSEDESLLDEIDVAELMSNSVHHGQELKKEELQKRLQQKRRDMNTNGDSAEEDPDVYDTFHQSQYFDLLHKAVEVEDAFLDSNLDSLGLEMLRGDDRRKGWGRLIRAPLKRKGHVLIDYCSAGCGGCSKNIPNDEDDWFEERRELPDGTQGRITRQKVSRGWSARSAPGCYSAARRARWGGLWPDLIRVKLDEIRQKKKRKLKNDS